MPRRDSRKVPSVSPIPSRPADSVPSRRISPARSPSPSPLGEGWGEGGFVSEFSLCPVPTIQSRSFALSQSAGRVGVSADRRRISSRARPNVRVPSQRSSPVPAIQSRPSDSVPSQRFSPVPTIQSRPNDSVPSQRFSPVPTDRTPRARRGRFPSIQKRIPTPPGIFFRPRRGSFPGRAEPIARRHLRFEQKLPSRWDRFAPTQAVVNYPRGQLPIESSGPHHTRFL